MSSFTVIVTATYEIESSDAFAAANRVITALSSGQPWPIALRTEVTDDA